MLGLRWLTPFASLALAVCALAQAPVQVKAAPDGGWVLIVAGKRYPCAVGRAGVAPLDAKREGDGRTPSGAFSFRCLYYRPDKVDPALLPRAWKPMALHPEDGWCDAPSDPKYNQFVKLPYGASHEELWRADAAYDLIVPLGYNDDPVIPGRGSAIFFHVAQPGYAPTSGCVAVSREHFLEILSATRPGDRMRIEARAEAEFPKPTPPAGATR